MYSCSYTYVLHRPTELFSRLSTLGLDHCEFILSQGEPDYQKGPAGSILTAKMVWEPVWL